MDQYNAVSTAGSWSRVILKFQQQSGFDVLQADSRGDHAVWACKLWRLGLVALQIRVLAIIRRFYTIRGCQHRLAKAGSLSEVCRRTYKKKKVGLSSLGL